MTTMTTRLLRGGLPAFTLCALLGALALPPAHAEGLDVSVAAARATKPNVKKFSVLFGLTRDDPLWQGEAWRLKLRHEVELAAWHVPLARNLVEAGYSPVLRLERPFSDGAVLFFDASIGVRLLSHTRVSPDHPLSSAFQFADMLGTGVQWGNSTVSLRFQHQSNAGIKRPNPGINFVQLGYTYRF